jgi:hypothetical protein
MPRPAGVMIASAWFVFAGTVIGFLAMVTLIGSIGLVQNPRGTTGIFANSALGGIGIFLAAIILFVAIAVAGLGVGLWRMRKWARLAAIAVMALSLPPCTSGLLNSLTPFRAGLFFRALIFVSSAAWMIWYLLQAEVKEAFGP